MARPFIVGRSGYPPPPECPLELPEISSTELRHALSVGESTAGRLAPSVAAYIEEHQLYRGIS